MICVVWLGLTTTLGQPPAKDRGAVLGKDWQGVQANLVQPLDRVQLADKSWAGVQPLRQVWRRDSGKIEMLNEVGDPIIYESGDIVAVEYFEERVLNQVNSLLGKKLDSDFLAAEQVLVELDRRHRSFRAGPALGKNPWQVWQERIDGKLQEVRAARLLDLAAHSENWKEALDLANRWLPMYRHAGPVREAIADLWTRQAVTLAKQGQGPQAFSSFLKLESEFPGRAANESVRGFLRAQVMELVKQASAASEADTLALLRQARSIWPDLPELEEALAKRRAPGSVLHVGAADVPEYLSPAAARTLIEKLALDLVFEDLPRLSLPTNSPGDHETPRWDLNPAAFWSNGKAITGGDVRHTVELLRRASSFTDEVMGSVALEDHPRRFSLALRQGVWEEPSVFRFAVLPEQYKGKLLTRSDDPEFAKTPIGSGPYRLAGTQSAKDRRVAVFRPNPYFLRPGPTIEEIRFQATSEGPPASSPWHLVLEPDSKLLKALGPQYRLVRLPPRGVRVLALNHRKPALANDSVRRALAHAIDRAKILAGMGNDIKGEALPANSLCFSGSWAQCPPPRVPAQLYQAETALSHAKKVGNLELTLSFSTGDPWAGMACQAIADQVAAMGTGLRLKLRPLTGPALHDEVRQHRFEIAYQPIEDPESLGTLWSLFDVRSEALKPGGSNFLGYQNDSKLEGLLRKLLLQRHFPPLREAYHNLNAHLHERMPLIPLWQMPTLVAIHSSLTLPVLEGPRIFRNVTEWKLAPLP